MAELKKGSGTIYPVDPHADRQRICIANGRVIDPANDIDETMNVYLSDGRVAAVGSAPPAGYTIDSEIDAKGCWVTPGLVDMHVHLREPGREDKETIFSGTCAAAAGGFTAVACMPNTSPVLDEESKIRYVIQRGERCPCRIHPVGAITKNLDGEELAPMGEMVDAGAKAVSDDGKSVRRSNIMRNALNYSRNFNIPVLCHSEDSDLSMGGHMNEGVISARIGVPGQPSVSEEICISRDILLAEYTGATIHICHVSTAGGVRMVREAKKRGVKVTAETCPHYVVLTENDCATYDTNKKMNPPLRTARDRAAIIEGLADGTIDVLASDHAPHVAEDKIVEFEAASFGVIGLETSLSVALTYLVAKDILLPSDLIEKMSVLPNRILRLPGGTLKPGSPADVTIIDPRPMWKVKPEEFFSKARNTAFEGFNLQGRTSCTIVDGRIVFKRNS